jgi:tRNA modification GTPase
MPTGDEVLLTRASPGAAFLMPLGSGLIVGSITRALESIGCDRRPESDPRERFPEARTLVEACALDALGHAPSPLAIDVILRQRERWDRVPPPPLAVSPNPLDNLLAPPRVVVVGRPNIGKSSVLNAMARRPIAIASDEPGTTRDHVGAEVECDGLIVRWIDTPGIPAPGSGRVADIDRIALERGPALVATADLLVLAADGSSGPIDPAELPARNPRMPLIRIALRADLGAPPGGSDVITSARTGQGLADLARVIRRSLVPDAALAEPARWRFHPFLPGG